MHNWSFTYNNTTYNNGHIYNGLEYEMSFIPEGDFTIGNCAASMVKFKTDVSFSVGDSFTVHYVGGDENQLRDLGIFYVDSIEEVKPSISGVPVLYNVVAYDYMVELDITIPENQIISGNYPIYSYLYALSTGYDFDLAFTPEDLPNANYTVNAGDFVAHNVTGRDYLKWIGEITGANFFFDEEESLHAIVGLPTTNKTISIYKRVVEKDFTTPVISRIFYGTRLGDLEYGTGSNQLRIDFNPLISSTSAAFIPNILAELNFSYKPTTYELYELWGLGPGYKINNTPVHSIRVTNSGTIINSIGNAIRKTGNENLNNQLQIDNKTISADRIVTGLLQDQDGNYSLNLETGEVNMKSANITGGNINISSAVDTDDYIILNGTYTKSTVSPQGFYVENKSNATSNSNEKSTMQGGLIGMYYNKNNDQKSTALIENITGSNTQYGRMLLFGYGTSSSTWTDGPVASYHNDKITLNQNYDRFSTGKNLVKVGYSQLDSAHDYGNIEVSQIASNGYLNNKAKMTPNEIVFTNATDAETCRLDKDGLDSTFIKYNGISVWSVPTVYQSRVTVVSGGYKQQGKLVTVQMKLRVNATLDTSDWWTIVDNMPKPTIPCPLAVYCRNNQSSTARNIADVVIGLDTNNPKRMYVCAMSDMHSGDELFINGTYYAE